jgi:hypothetical protein
MKTMKRERSNSCDSSDDFIVNDNEVESGESEESESERSESESSLSERETDEEEDSFSVASDEPESVEEEDEETMVRLFEEDKERQKSLFEEAIQEELSAEKDAHNIGCMKFLQPEEERTFIYGLYHAKNGNFTKFSQNLFVRKHLPFEEVKKNWGRDMGPAQQNVAWFFSKCISGKKIEITKCEKPVRSVCFLCGETRHCSYSMDSNPVGSDCAKLAESIADLLSLILTIAKNGSIVELQQKWTEIGRLSERMMLAYAGKSNGNKRRKTE